MKKGSIKHPTVGNMRWCWTCQQYKPLAEFYKDKSRKLGLDRICKSCKSGYYRKYQHDYYTKHREELLPKHRIAAIKSIERRKKQL